MSAAFTMHPRFAELVARRMLRGKIEHAVERLLAVLDDIDGDPDLEPDEDADDTERGEETLGWPANVSQLALGTNTADGDLTAPERHGGGFVPCGADDLEDGFDREVDNRELPLNEAEEAAWYPRA